MIFFEANRSDDPTLDMIQYHSPGRAVISDESSMQGQFHWLFSRKILGNVAVLLDVEKVYGTMRQDDFPTCAS